VNLTILLEILGVVIPLIHGTGLVLAAHAILFARTPQGSIAWAMSLALFPYFAVPMYLVLSRKKFHGYVEARRKGDRHIDHLADNLADTLQQYRSSLPGEAQRFETLEHLGLFPFTAGNGARLLVDGEQTFAAIFAAIEQAAGYLLVQFFIIRDDELGRRLIDLLVGKARQRVRVHLLYDEIGCIRLPKRFFDSLRLAGAHVHPFNTRRGWRNRFQINFRNHRKVVVADGQVAFVGGHNVGEEYLGKAARFGRWRDTHVEVRGPAVAAVQWSFLEDWHWATREVLELPGMSAAAGVAPPAPVVDESDAQSPRAITAEPSAPPSYRFAPNASVLVVPSGPADDISTCTLMFLAIITAARKRLWISSPYFVPDETVYDALQLAAIRGVDVRIMLPEKPDHILVYLSSFSYLKSAEHVGVKFYRYQAGFLHQKVLLVDDDLAAVGTANLDNRSMHLNFEITLLFVDRSFAHEVATMLRQDFANCQRATPGDLGRRRLPFQVAVRLARLFSPIQ
jgi:cardiolipin synthase A/B